MRTLNPKLALKALEQHHERLTRLLPLIEAAQSAALEHERHYGSGGGSSRETRASTTWH